METERIELSQRERDWLKVLHEVGQKHLTQVEAAQRLKRTDRQVRRMLIRMREHGDGGIASSTPRAALEPQVGRGLGAEDSGAGWAAVCGLRAHVSCRTIGPRRVAGEPGDLAEVDDPGGLVDPAPP